jgi:hypothetical protein
MKRLFTILMLLSIFVLKAQSFSFDHSLLYKIKEEHSIYGPERFVFIAYSSQNSNIIFRMTFWGKEGDCYVLDFSNRISHQFKIKDINQMSDFIYYGSQKWKDKQPLSYDFCDRFVLTHQEEGDIEKWEQKEYTSAKKKKLNFQYNVTAKSNIEAPFYRISNLLNHHIWGCDESVKTVKGIPNTITILENNNTIFFSELIKQSSSPMTIEVQPENIKYFD